MGCKLKCVLLTMILLLVNCGYPSRSVGRHEPLDANFQDIYYDTPAHFGEEAVWGGEVLSIAYIPEGTELTMRQVPITPRGMPWRTAYSAGRFIIHSKGKLDASKYGPRTMLMVKGIVAGSVSKPIGDYSTYTYPVVNADELHYWKLDGDYGLKHCWESMGWQGPYDWHCDGEEIDR
jgi:starvation-inducible outer membrane lipoprotein